MNETPSIPFPETAERRAAISRSVQAETGLDEAMLERLVRAFYAAARRYAVLGPAFDGIGDWEKHIAKIPAFWSSVALMTGRYHGQPLAAHFPLQLQPRHFVRWLALFEATTREVCTAEGSAHLIEKARRIARSLALSMTAHRGVLQSRIGSRQ